MKIRAVLYLIPFVAVLVFASSTPGAIWIDLSAYGLSDLEGALDPGDHFHLAFVTTGRTTLDTSDIGDYNTFVQDQAQLAGSLTKGFTEDLGVVWNAIGSTPAVHAKDNIGYSSSDVPVYLLIGAKIADSSTDMWDGWLDSKPSVNQYGWVENHIVATGSTETGVLYSGYGLGEIRLRFGHCAAEDYNWINYMTFWGTPDYPASLYAFSGELVYGAAVPEPSTLVGLLSLGAMGLLGHWWKRRKAA